MNKQKPPGADISFLADIALLIIKHATDTFLRIDTPVLTRVSNIVQRSSWY